MDNQEPFLRAFGSAFHTGIPAVVRPKELHVLTHDRDGGALEDTLVLGDTAVVNRTRVGHPCEIVGPDGATMTVTARWDGDVWVEVDDSLVMETRRWREGELLVVARTVTNDDGTLVTSKAFMGAPRTKAPAFEAPSPAAAALSPPGGPAMLSSTPAIGMKGSGLKKGTRKGGVLGADGDFDDSRSDSGSVYSQVMDAARGLMFGESSPGGSERGLTNRGGAGARASAEFFGLDPARVPLRGAFPCSLKGATGHLYIFEFHVGFGAVHLTDVNRWGTPAKLINNLEISGAAKLSVGLSTGAVLNFDDVEDRDAAYDCMVNMLEKIPPSPDEEVHGGDPTHRVPVPLRLGFEPERYVIVHVSRTEFLPETCAGCIPIAIAAMGRYGTAVPSGGVWTPGVYSPFNRTLIFPAAEADLAADAVDITVMAGGLGDGGQTVGKCTLPLAMMPRTRAGANEVKANPWTVGVKSMDDADGDDDGGRRVSDDFSEEYVKTPASGGKRRHSGRVPPAGELTIAAWIGTAADVNELGGGAITAKLSAGANDANKPAVVRVPPAVSRVTVNVHRVRGVQTKGLARIDEDESGADVDDAVALTCRLAIGGQVHETPPASHSPAEQAGWPAPDVPMTFTAPEPRSGLLNLDLLGPDGESIGRVDVDLASLQLRPKEGAPRRHWIKLRAPPAPDAPSVTTSARTSVRSGSSRRHKRKSGDGAGGGFFGGFFGGGQPSQPSTVYEEGESESEYDGYSDEDETDATSETGTDFTGETDEEEYFGEVLVDGFVDEGCGPTAGIGKKPPLGELSLEILSIRGCTPEGGGRKSAPAVMLKLGGSWAHLPASTSGGGAPAEWRREIIAAVYDGSDCAEIGVFDQSAEALTPLGFVNVPVRKLPRGYPMVSTLALGGARESNPHAEITIRAKFTPLVSRGAQLFQSMSPPLPTSAYVHEGVGAAELVRLQRELALESLLEGPAPLPESMVFAMLPQPKPAAATQKAAAKGVKACTVRIAAALETYRLELAFVARAVAWESPVAAGFLHVFILWALFNPNAVFPCLALWLAVRMSVFSRGGQWTLLGADKSHAAGSFDVRVAPPGSKLAGSEVAGLVGKAPSLAGSSVGGAVVAMSKRAHTSASRALGVNPGVDAYEGCVQTAYWAQALARHAVPLAESLHDLVTWQDAGRSNAFMMFCFGASFFTIWVKLRVVVLVACFVALRHPAMWKPATQPFRLALAAE